ncbi:type II toxin-antitoxin system RelE/ParE family toxin [uncultured Alsobacter sp.]|uniref:type II toxin-antitoxin system RelE/ParE family toxin n=1 Tax=uncultured Alsobacter sp. TaxID=1748258 RepID=UPI00345CF066
MWQVAFFDDFDHEFAKLEEQVQDALLASILLLHRFGPALGRPHADVLFGSAFSNMKELRVTTAGGAWRLAFAFDPQRKAILLVAGNKAGSAQRRFYRNLVAIADRRYRRHLDRLATLGLEEH